MRCVHNAHVLHATIIKHIALLLSRYLNNLHNLFPLAQPNYPTSALCFSLSLSPSLSLSVTMLTDRVSRLPRFRFHSSPRVINSVLRYADVNTFFDSVNHGSPEKMLLSSYRPSNRPITTSFTTSYGIQRISLLRN